MWSNDDTDSIKVSWKVTLHMKYSIYRTLWLVFQSPIRFSFWTVLYLLPCDYYRICCPGPEEVTISDIYCIFQFRAMSPNWTVCEWDRLGARVAGQTLRQIEEEEEEGYLPCDKCCSSATVLDTIPTTLSANLLPRDGTRRVGEQQCKLKIKRPEASVCHCLVRSRDRSVLLDAWCGA